MIYTELKTGKEYEKIDGSAIFALGNFDGLHIGHRTVICETVEKAVQNGAYSVAWCLSSPVSVEKCEVLTTKEEKISLLKDLGCDFAVFEDFENVRDMGEEEFVRDYLIPAGCTGVVCGFNFRYGKNAVGDKESLSRICSENGILCHSTQAVYHNGTTVSSSRIRSLLKDGDVEKVHELLKAPYSLTGTVEGGRHIGKSFGFPTVNINFENGKLVPRHGVYFSYVLIGKKLYPSVSNVGSRPTVEGRSTRMETYIMNFDGDLYGTTLTVMLEKFRRDEKKFSSKEELIESINADKNAAEEYFGLK